VINKGTQQRFPVLEFAAVATGQVRQRVDLSQGYIGQGVGLEIGPHILHRVQFRGIRGQELDMHTRMALEPTMHDPGAMGCQTIPNQNNRSKSLT
jgi:hypothetical protein